MKKLISLLLTFAILVSVCTISAMGAGVLDPESLDIEINPKNNKDVASTGADEYFYSNEPYEDVSPKYGYVIGYVGDADSDGVITVMDATEIQLYDVGKKDLGDAYWLADTDDDGSVTVMDATEIQLYDVGKISADDTFICHTLYVNDTQYLTYDEIAAFLMENGEYYEDEEDPQYSYYSHDNYIEEYDCYMTIEYSPGFENINFWLSFSDEASDVNCSASITVWLGDTEFEYYSNIYTYSEDSPYPQDLYSAYGFATLSDEGEFIYDDEYSYFESEEGLTFEDAKPVISESLIACINIADYYLWDYISGYVTDMFY